jgi:hypothetical protein
MNDMNGLDGKNLDDLLAECDSLLEKIDSELIDEVAEEKRLQLEIQQAALRKSKAVAEMAAGPDSGPAGSFSEGMHEAIDELVKAIRETALILR